MLPRRRHLRDDPRHSDTVLGAFAMLVVAACIVVLAMCQGCSAPGYARYHYRDADRVETITVRQPSDAIETATIRRTHEGGMDASTGRSQRVDHVGVAQVRYRVWIGAGVMLIGIATLIVRAWLPGVPMSASLLAIGSGLAIAMLPPMPPLLTYGALGLVGLLYAIGGWDNLLKLRGSFSREK